MELVVGVDIGGTKTAAALVARDGTIGSIHTAPTRAHEGPAHVLAVVASVVREATGGARPAAVGVGSAGMIDSGRGVVVGANDTFPGWPGTPIAARLSESLGALVTVQHDVAAHAAGEAWTGAAAGARSALVVAVGTGIGSAFVLDARPVAGAHHAHGEMGHMPSGLAQDLICPCGRIGHLEAIASGPAIAARHAQLSTGLAHTAERLGTPEVLARAADGDEVAVRVVQDAGRALGQALAGVITVLDPELVALGGGVVGRSALWWNTVEQTVRSELVTPIVDIPLRASRLGRAAPIVGAARSAWDMLERP